MVLTGPQGGEVMKIQCPECRATSFVVEFPEPSVEQICQECGASFTMEAHLLFDGDAVGVEEELRSMAADRVE